MPRITIDGIDLDAQPGWTVLEAARFLGTDIPTLCTLDGLSPYGGCRLCVVETGVGKRARLVTACTYPVEEGLAVRTNSEWVIRTRKMLIELLLSVCPSSKVIQDMAAKFGVQQMRFKARDEDCILCGLCVRMCEEQMSAKAIGFVGRGQSRKVTTPYDKTSDACRRCGGCMQVCPVCTTRCHGANAGDSICGNCMPLQPTCIEQSDDLLCYLGPTGNCGTCVKDSGKAKDKAVLGGV